MAKRIISVERNIPGDTGVELVEFKSNNSLLDADIVIFSPSFESAVLEALRIFEFRAENYKDPESEVDVLFVDPDGEQLLGEAEGKNDKAVNIDKLDQLNRNVQEEFAKRSDTKYSKGVLFGNAFRLTPLTERGEYFTDKCKAGAARLGFALVRTPDLFPVAKYLKENRDPDFARKCRAEILNTSGKVVVFPPIPPITGVEVE